MPSDKDVTLNQRVQDLTQRTLGDLDALMQQMKADEKADAEESGFTTPIIYASTRGIHAQRVYKALRDKKLSSEYCKCGRRIISVAEADKLFKFSKPEEDNAADD